MSSGVKIYVASSWKVADGVRIVADMLRNSGFEVDCFCEQLKGRLGFNIADELRKAGGRLEDVDCITALQNPAIDDIFKTVFAEDKKWLDWCNCVVMCLPCGKSAHLEAGYAKGQGKLFYIYSMTDLPKGEFDAMYQFADGIFRNSEFSDMVDSIRESTKRKRTDEIPESDFKV